MNLPFKKGHEIGLGTEGVVYEISDTDRAVKIYDKETKTSKRLVRGRAYLIKILNLLLPEHTIKSYCSFSEPDSIIMKRVNFVGAHDKLRKDQLGTSFLSYDECDGVRLELEELRKKSGILEKFKKIGISTFDNSFPNFGEDEEGNIKYTDTIEPWGFKDGSLVLYFDQKKMKKSIIENFSDDTRQCRIALNYLSRLVKLFEEEQAEFIQKNSKL